MKRRNFGFYTGAGLATMKMTTSFADTAKDPNLLKTTLTPTGAERAASADGSIPAWTGGLTTLPEGCTPNGYIPELFPNEKPVVVISASNMAQYSARLSEGVMAMMTKYGFSINVYPTHRTCAYPQYIYDNIAQNLPRAQLSPAGGRLGFTGGYGGIPFPIPDTNTPLDAGAQIIWNHLCAFNGYSYQADHHGYAISGGQPALCFKVVQRYVWPYFDPNGSLAAFDGRLQLQNDQYYAPGNLNGQALLVWQYTLPGQHPTDAWEYLNGQGRVRRAPEVSFDTPASAQTNDIAAYDEFFMFNGSPERYDWTYLGKQEMYIPYNNNKMYGGPPEDLIQAHFFNPDLVRWELHRCWVVEATLHPGERNVLARRRYYVDEDSWVGTVGDMWDANNNLFKANILYNYTRPDLPGVVYGQETVNNLQTDQYAALAGLFDQATNGSGLQFGSGYPPSLYDPNNLAAASQY